MFDEKEIAKMMKALDLTREEAIQLLKDDANDVTVELTPEQKKAVKSVTKGDRKKETTPRKREVKPDLVKREIIETVAQNLDRCFFDNTKIHSIQIVNIEKEITFKVGEDEFSITLTKHRKKKKGD